MAKSTTVVRDEKQGPQPERAVTKAKVADKLAERGQEFRAGKSADRDVHQDRGFSQGCAQRNAQGHHAVAGGSAHHDDGGDRDGVCVCRLLLCSGRRTQPGHPVLAALAGRGSVNVEREIREIDDGRKSRARHSRLATLRKGSRPRPTIVSSGTSFTRTRVLSAK